MQTDAVTICYQKRLSHRRELIFDFYPFHIANRRCFFFFKLYSLACRRWHRDQPPARFWAVVLADPKIHIIAFGHGLIVKHPVGARVKNEDKSIFGRVIVESVPFVVGIFHNSKYNRYP